MAIGTRTQRTVYHGAPRPDLATQQHDVLALIESLAARIETLETEGASSLEALALRVAALEDEVFED